MNQCYADKNTAKNTYKFKNSWPRQIYHSHSDVTPHN